MVKKFACLGMVFIALLFVLTGCSKYNSVLYSHAEEWIDDDFLKENRVKGAYIITEEAEFDSIFTKCTVEVNFDEEMVILYTLTDLYPGRDYYLRKVSLKDNVLTIYYELEYKNGKDATMPYQRCFMVTMDKKDITEVVFIEK